VHLSDKLAQIEWLLPLTEVLDKPLPLLIDNLCLESGLRGARLLTASAPVEGDLFEILRRCGFTTYDWHTFWKVNQPISEFDMKIWQKPTEYDAPTVLWLQKCLIPPAVQAVYQPGLQNLQGYILRVDSNILGFANLLAGRNAVVVTPFLSPEVDNPFAIIASLCARFLTSERQVYIRQTSSMSWLTIHLEVGANLFLKRQELLVKHFTVCNTVSVADMNAAIKSRHADPAVPFAQSTDSMNHL
jgi:hypothetical protein